MSASIGFSRARAVPSASVAAYRPYRVLVWQWARFGSGPRFASLLADGFRGLPGVAVTLSLSAEAEWLRAGGGCDLPVRTYRGVASFLLRVLSAPLMVASLVRQLWRDRPDLAVCAHPGPLDLAMAAALWLLGVRFVTIVHDADPHPGDNVPLLMALQRLLCRSAGAVAALSGHVAERLRSQGLRQVIQGFFPPMPYPGAAPARGEGPYRVLFFGRLLPYKGLDLLAEALALLGPRDDLAVRVVGAGPESPELDALRALPGVTVENRWVPEDAVADLIAWADAVVLPYREASQSGVAAVALAAWVPIIATRVGGLAEQLAAVPGTVLCEATAEGLAKALTTAPRMPAGREPPQAATAIAWQRLALRLLEESEHAPAEGRVARYQSLPTG